MKKDTAKQLMARLHNLGAAIEDVSVKVEQIDVDSQKYIYRRITADMARLLYADLMVLLVKEYPELGPDK